MVNQTASDMRPSAAVGEPWNTGFEWMRVGDAVTPVLVLLVEDEPLIRMDVESALADAGFEAVGA